MSKLFNAIIGYIDQKTAAAKADAELKNQQKAESVKRTEAIDKKAFFRKVKWGFRGALVVGAVAAGVSVYNKYQELKEDYMQNDHEPTIRERVKTKLQHYTGPEPLKEPLPLPLGQETFMPAGNKGTMLLGGTGAGKSTLLVSIAHDAAKKGRPVMLVHMRLSGEDQQAEKKSEAGSERLLHNILESVCTAMDYPVRSSVAATLLKQGFTVKETEFPPLIATTNRLQDAISAVFAAAEELYNERLAQGISKEDAKPLLIFDEVQDLVKDERLAKDGGRAAFRHLATKLALGCVDKHYCHAVVAGSSAALDVEFEDTVMCDPRWQYYELADPDVKAVKERLQERGYDAAEADRLVDTFGTRMSLLDEPLMVGKKNCKADAYISSRLNGAAGKIRDLLESLPAEDKLLLIAAMDLMSGEAPIPIQQRRLPQTVRDHRYFNKIFFLQQDKFVRFQNRLMERAWMTQLRSGFVQSPKQMQSLKAQLQMPLLDKPMK